MLSTPSDFTFDDTCRTMKWTFHHQLLSSTTTDGENVSPAQFEIRPYHPSDLCSLIRICLQTGDSGNDASAHFEDPELLGLFYAAPYAVFEPDLCFILTHNGAPSGYILGTRDTPVFHARSEQEWFPVLRERYAMPDEDVQSADAHMIRAIHRGYSTEKNVAAYPAHLHIDILPAGQGQRLGSKLMATFLNRLREIAVPAVYLGVSKRNPRAVRFYEREGFHIIEEYEGGIDMGMRL
jgi:ribosomal protein S18 acetylase RimI-like enzyme